jgi:hypothetical protein
MFVMGADAEMGGREVLLRNNVVSSVGKYCRGRCVQLETEGDTLPRADSMLV